MTYPAFRHTLCYTLPDYIWAHVTVSALVNHLWQSTVVVLAAWLLALCMRRTPARTRYWVWMTASVKFLVPFSLFIAAGESLRSLVSAPVQSPRLATVMQQITQPFAHASAPVGFTDFGLTTQTPVAAHSTHWLPIVLAGIWLCGALTVVFSWTRSWLQVRAMVRSAVAIAPQGMRDATIPILATDRLLEPGVFGILRPVLLLPRNITERLSAQQLAAILAHEMAHVRRRDNLTAALHMAVCALFWFHPAAWWVKARLLEERECACDEAVLQSGNPAELYAESILSVCRFYVESPLACMSGVTGADLKQRIVRIMSGHATLRLGLGRKLLLAAAGLLIVAAPVTVGLVHITAVHAQAAAPAKDEGLAGTWQGTLHAGQDLRTVVKITKQPDGSYTSMFYSIDQNGQGPVDTTTLQGSDVKFSVIAIGGKYEGKLSADGNTITGNWSQGPTPLPLVLTRATPETAWTIPSPPSRIPPMDANASPTFEVATIKPSKPDARGEGFRVQGRRFSTLNTSLSQLISFCYQVQAKQIIGLPPWAETDKYDLDAVPDGVGAPSDKQWKEMLQKLLASRWNLTFHREKRELAVYSLSIAKSGPKLTKSQGDPNGLPGLFFRGRPGDLFVTNATMADFTQLLQSVVMDRPVIDQTGITGRWNFTLDWTPDDSQFGGMAASIAPQPAGNPSPNLYTAVQEQIGLKLDATKAPAEVMVIDHIDHPSPN